MRVESLEIPDVKLLVPSRFTDDRGWFSESYNQRVLSHYGLELNFVQDNHSYSTMVGTVRGLHYQSNPFPQDKLVRVLSGSIIDVAVDARKGSPSYGKHIRVKLTAKGGEQLFVPIGFLHGFITLEPETEVAYKVSNFYSKDHDGSVLWKDPNLGIDWGEFADKAQLSAKDEAARPWSEFDSPFVY